VSRPERGRIIRATVLDPQGRNPKVRPLVIVSRTEDIKSGETFLAVAISGELPKPLPDSYVRLPWHPQRHPRTGLKKDCAAICTWYVTLTEADITEYGGIVPSAQMQAILTRLAVIGALPVVPGSDSTTPAT
jgi:mRNA-degrading endonuclease toxin of MazEF toxin-antitoxin module